MVASRRAGTVLPRLVAKIGWHIPKPSVSVAERIMSSFVLVHGAWHGGWEWEHLVPLLEAKGHMVSAPDLPGHGEDRTPIHQVTLDSYVQRIGEVLERHEEPAVLVGTSMGGLVVTQAAETFTDKCRKLVYLTAFLPQNGQTLLNLAGQVDTSLVLPNIQFSEDRIRMSLRREAIKEALYGDCGDEDVARAADRMVEQATVIFETPVVTTPERFGRLPRVYIECLQDRAIPLALQRMMQQAMPCDEVYALNTSHKPTVSAPQALADILEKL